MNELLGARIKSLREVRGVKQEELAKEIDCTRQTYAKIEKGLTDISYSTITKIAKALHAKPEEITSAINETPVVPIMDKFEFISNMLDTFLTHKKLYNSVRQVNIDE